MRARKRFAQHFLEPAWVNKLVAAVGATPDDAILEIGPGRGAITRPLAAQAGTLLAIEVDRDLAAELEATKPANVTVVTGDVLRWISCRSSPVGWVWRRGRRPIPDRRQPSLQHLLAHPVHPPRARGDHQWVRDALLMLQKEVADRLIAKVGTGDYGVLTVLTGSRRCDAGLSLPPGAFGLHQRRIPPSSGWHSAPRRWTWGPGCFVRMVRTMFTQRRKTLGNALKPFGVEIGKPVQRGDRPHGNRSPTASQTLELAEFAALAKAFTRPSSAKSRSGEEG